MKLKLFAETIALCKLRPHVEMADWQAALNDGPLKVFIDDPHGKTVICSKAASAERSTDVLDRSLWRCIQIDEIFDVDSIGVVAEFSRLLAERDISLFVISSYETDYLLIQPKRIDDAVKAFSLAGHSVSRA